MKKVIIFLWINTLFLTILLGIGYAGQYTLNDSIFIDKGWGKPLDRTLYTSTYYDYDSPVYYNNFGFRHGGVDIVANLNEAVYAIDDGVVKKIVKRDSSTYNLSIIYVKHTTADGSDFLVLYGHVYAKSGLYTGDTVSKNEYIGNIKRYGSPDHVHFGISTNLNDYTYDRWGGIKGGIVNPIDYLNGHSNTTDYPKISNGIYITPSTVKLNKTFNITFTLKEISGHSITFDKIAVAVHRSNNDHLYDVDIYYNVRIPANSTFTKTVSTKIYNNPPGTYIAIIKGYKNGEWFHFESEYGGNNEKKFTVVDDDNGGGDSSCPQGQIPDCDGKCVSESKANSWLGDNYCDDGYYGMNLFCSQFDYDKGDCY